MIGTITHTTRFSEQGMGRTEQPAKCKQRQARTEKRMQTEELTLARKYKGERLMEMGN